MTFLLLLRYVLSGAVFALAVSALFREVRKGRDAHAGLWALCALLSAYVVLANIEALQ